MLAIIRCRTFFPSLLLKNINIKIYKTTIFLVVMYGCETWSLILRKKRSLRMFKKRVLMGIFGSKRDEVKGECLLTCLLRGLCPRNRHVNNERGT